MRSGSNFTFQQASDAAHALAVISLQAQTCQAIGEFSEKCAKNQAIIVKYIAKNGAFDPETDGDIDKTVSKVGGTKEQQIQDIMNIINEQERKMQTAYTDAPRKGETDSLRSCGCKRDPDKCADRSKHNYTNLETEFAKCQAMFQQIQNMNRDLPLNSKPADLKKLIGDTLQKAKATQKQQGTMNVTPFDGAYH